jgi:hypothetical protein
MKIIMFVNRVGEANLYIDRFIINLLQAVILMVR